MYRRFHSRFGTAGVVVAVIALVVALSGTALAASGALTGKQKKEVEKIAKKYSGKPGAPGAAGANGTAGTNGTNGKNGAPGEKGPKGDPGTNGTNGTDGEDGKSVEAFPSDGEPGEACEGTGGAEYEVEDSSISTEVCSGKEGSPWTAGGTLPPKATETGVWYVTGGAAGEVYAPLSFPVPVPKFVTAAHIFYGTGEEPEVEISPGVFEPTEFKKHCPAANYANPSVANAGELCIYRSTFSNVEATFTNVYRMGLVEPAGTGRSGGLLALNLAGPGTVMGSFAVKGCSTTLPEGDPDKCP